MEINVLINKVLKYNNNLDEIIMIKKAYYLAEELHKDQTRQSGEAYITHPLAVAIILSEIEADASTIVAGLLHDIVEDTELTIEEITSIFNSYIALLVDGVTKIEKMNFSSKDEEVAGNTRKLLSGITEDVRIILIKLADRLHNMRTLEFKSRDKQKENAIETLEIFVPIAYHLGCYDIKNELEDLSLKYLNPESYYKISEERKKLEKDATEDLLIMLNKIHNILNENSIPNYIKTRIKNIYGIYKNKKEGKTLTEIHDFLSLKVIVDTINDCYLSLGYIHSLYPPIHGKMKDYISSPKTNMYRSLHTTSFGEGEQLVQVQIKTNEMDKVASLGLTAYWQDEDVIMNDELKTRFQFFKSLVEINQSTGDNQEFLEEIKKDILGNNIYIYSPKGDVIQLPHGSTAVDFAYKINDLVGDNIVAAIVNGNYKEPLTLLKNKDIVKILTDELSSGPKKEWISQCKTPLAKRKILSYYDKSVISED